MYGGAGEDILIDIEGGDAIFGDGNADGTLEVTILLWLVKAQPLVDLSPDGTGLSGRTNQANDLFCSGHGCLTCCSGFGLQQIYEP